MIQNLAVLKKKYPLPTECNRISKKERGEKPKDKKDENNFVYAAKMAKKNGEKTFTIGGKEYNVEDYIEEEKLDEKVEYVEYQFKNKNDAMAAKKI